MEVRMEREKYFMEGGEYIEVTYFDVPMFHDDWHEADKLGLEYVKYNHNGPDYWDDSMMFCKAEDRERLEKYIKEHTW
jgi:hypothetical protein